MVLIGSQPEDFVVDEIPLYEPTGQGEHTFVRIEKRDLTTAELVRRVAHQVGCKPREIGYAGRKDRQAITRQWLSVPHLAPERAARLEDPRFRVLEAKRHVHKLRLGDLVANRFELVVREVSADDSARAARLLPEIERAGLANRFGPQRFGRDGANAARGRKILESGRVSGDVREAGLMLSAFQAEVFNRVLSERPLPLDQVELGDWVLQHQSGGFYLVREVEREHEHARSFRISATGPLFGTHAAEARGEPGAREQRIFAELGVPPMESLLALRGLRLRGGRRALRVQVSELRWALDETALRLTFSLPAGSYATVLLQELFPAAPEGSSPISVEG